ncbi:hypothetical protein GCM10023258_03330 [Terrabacter aeriphilus]|uniref:Secreted protein n=1 Tax=Terrabacter aeriphilus TaxID=515662 RepID=A0ABP9J1B5_9MICO
MRKRATYAGFTTLGIAVGVLVSPPAVQAAVNYFDTTKTVSGTGSVACPAGTRMTGGGVGSLPDDVFGYTSSREYLLTGSMPNANGWKATAKQITGKYSDANGWTFRTTSYSAKVFAVCAS